MYRVTAMIRKLRRQRFTPGRRAKTWNLALVLVAGSLFLPSVFQGFGGLLQHADLISMRKPGTLLALSSPIRLNKHFDDIGYELDAVRSGANPVPRIFLAKVPKGLADVKRIEERKAAFLRVMLPLVLKANERVLRQRAQLRVIDAKLAADMTLTPDQEQRLNAIAAEYRTDPERIDLLLRKVDAVPPSLALAQAAIESGWGTSRFVIEGNAAFGQWTSGNQAGIVPLGREEGKTHKIKSFQTLSGSVHAYLRNLNMHRAYREFRDMRLMMRAEGQRLDGTALVPAMSAYSETNDVYLKLLRKVIDANDLAPLDGARLRGTDA